MVLWLTQGCKTNLKGFGVLFGGPLLVFVLFFILIPNYLAKAPILTLY